jgi:hypothetical protein
MAQEGRIYTAQIRTADARLVYNEGVALHLLHIKCPECSGINVMRRPNNTLLISKIVAAFVCWHCHPEALVHVCGGCHLPFIVVKRHSNGLCNTCAVRSLRYKTEAPAIL